LELLLHVWFVDNFSLPFHHSPSHGNDTIQSEDLDNSFNTLLVPLTCSNNSKTNTTTSASTTQDVSLDSHNAPQLYLNPNLNPNINQNLQLQPYNLDIFQLNPYIPNFILVDQNANQRKAYSFGYDPTSPVGIQNFPISESDSSNYINETELLTIEDLIQWLGNDNAHSIVDILHFANLYNFSLQDV
ncbi:hypothetical protein Leryth_024545, partial [Lithospermum erythrorhizon]